MRGVMGQADRKGPLKDYCMGLLASEGRKSVEPMAAGTTPGRLSAQHQKLLHFIANAPRSDEQMLAKVREMVFPAIKRNHPIKDCITDNTACPKHAIHSACG